ncbi:hypothetical protein KR222_007796 [Zaprionus bogoriensis]|nr:hypothetical protein KR222_007796 [Zaprionus bogoriensis]
MRARIVPEVALLAVLLLQLGSAAAGVGRLVEGDAAAVGSHPYSVSLQRNGAHICGGALIGQQLGLTAAHCVTSGSGIQSYPPRSFLLRVGSIQRLAGGQLVQISRIVVHSEYSGALNDLALLVLQQPVTLTANAQPIALATQAPPSGASIVFTGWGAQRTQGTISQRLQVGSQQALSADECVEQLHLEHDGLLCLQAEDAQGLCAGDAGAPAVYQNQLVGIGAFYVGGCGGSQPDGFTNVANYRDWILANSP